MWKSGLRLISPFGMLILAGSAAAQEIPNPLGNTSSFPQLIQNITQALIPVAFTVAVLAIIIAGLKFITAASQGNEAGLKEAKKIFWYTLIGTAIVVGSYAIASAVYNLLKTI